MKDGVAFTVKCLETEKASASDISGRNIMENHRQQVFNCVLVSTTPTGRSRHADSADESY